MKYLIAFLALCAATCATAEAALLRSTLIVADVDRAIAFYDQLGLHVESDRGGPRKPDSPFPLATASKTFRLVILQSSDPQGGKLGLLSFGEPQPPVLVPARDRVGIGDVVLVVSHPDAVALFDVLRQSGARLVEPEPVAYEMKRPDGSTGRGRLFHVFDPDGRLVEVMAPAMDAPAAGK